MDTQKLLHEQKMVAEAAAAGFCIPPRENRKSLFDGLSNGRANGFKVSGLDYRKFINEQQALEQAEAAGFCVPRSTLKLPNKQFSEWDTQVSRDMYGANNRRTTTTDYWRGSGDAPAGRSTTVSRSNDDEEEEEEGEGVCHRDLSDESFLLRDPFEAKATKNVDGEPFTSQPSIAGQTAPRSASHRTCRTEILSRVSTRVTNHLPSLPSTRPPTRTNQDGTWPARNLIFVLIYGLVLFLFAELLFQMYGRKYQPSKRARSSLLRLIIDDLIYYVTRHFTAGEHEIE